MRHTIDTTFDKALRRAGRVTTTQAAGAAVDLGDNHSAKKNLVVLDVGNVTGTTPTLDGTIEGSDDGTSWETVATFTQVTAAGAQFLSVKPKRRYRHGVLTVAGTTPVFDLGIYLLGSPSRRPVTQAI